MDIKYFFRNKKKALLFSLISLLFSALFITLFSQNILTTQEDRIISSNIRVKVIDTYVRNFEVYLGDSIRVSSYKTLDAITVYRDSSGTRFFSNEDQFKTAFNNCMMCGYFDCSTNVTSCGLNGDHLTAKIEDVVNLSLYQLNINTTYAIHSINITQNYPFEVEVTVNLSYNVTDNSGVNNYARWNRTQIITESVTIIGLLDPLGYMNDSSNTYARRINSTQICDIGETCWNFANTQAFYIERSFRYYANGTSFLQRYWNSYAPSDCCGIETIIHPGEITGINLANSYIDHYYWSGNYTCTAANNIVNVTFGTDSVHFDEIGSSRYGLSNDAVIYCRP